jgi:hypothetical protein
VSFDRGKFHFVSSLFYFLGFFSSLFLDTAFNLNWANLINEKLVFKR